MAQAKNTGATNNPPADDKKETAEETGAVTTETTDETSEDTIKSGFFKVHVEGFRGAYKDVKFGDDCICPRIGYNTLDQLKGDFPNAKITPMEKVD